MIRRSLVAAAVCVLAGCGSSSATSTSTSSTSVAATTTTTTATTVRAPTGVATTVTSPPVPIGQASSVVPTSSAATTSAAGAPVTSVAAPSAATSTVAPSALVMRANGLGVAAFGSDPDQVIATVSAVLGPPTLDSGWMDPLSLGSCPGTEVRSVRFGDLVLDFADESTVLTGRRHFFAYSYGPATDPTGLSIEGGGTLGTTVAALRAAHPSVQIYPADPTAPASFAISDGLTGALTGTADTDTVTKVQGGIGCGE